VDFGHGAAPLIIIKARERQRYKAVVFHDHAKHRAELNHVAVCIFFHGDTTP